MPAPLPSALRARFAEYVSEGLSGRAAAARLKLSAATRPGSGGNVSDARAAQLSPRPEAAREDMESAHLIRPFSKNWWPRTVTPHDLNLSLIHI